MKNPIFITGCPRSGAGLIARIVKLCGAEGGNLNSVYENVDIKYHVFTPCMEKRNTQYPLPNVHDILIPVNIKGKTEELINSNDKAWFIKGSELALLYPIFNYAFPNAKWIIVRRRTGDIIQSCLKTAYMDAFEDEKIRIKINVDTEIEGWKWWVHQYEDRFVSMIQKGLNCKVIYPDRMEVGDYQQIEETIEWLGLTWNNEVLSIMPNLIKTERK